VAEEFHTRGVGRVNIKTFVTGREGGNKGFEDRDQKAAGKAQNEKT